MAVRTIYYAGGYDPEAPAQNKAEEWDSSSQTYTSWDKDGVVLVSRPFNDAETAAVAAAEAATALNVNRSTLTSKAKAALATNATYIGLASPTAAQTTAQVKALSRECNALIRLLLNELDDISNT